jgi:hypothetical protein
MEGAKTHTLEYQQERMLRTLARYLAEVSPNQTP